MKMPTFDTAPEKEKVYSGFGKSMLHKMGWKEGEGIGKHKQGMAEALKVKRRDGEIGLGAEEALRYKWEEKWWEGHFKSAADKFAEAVSANVGSDSDDSDHGDSDSDSEMKRQLTSCAVDANGNDVIDTGKVKGRDGIYYSGKKSDFDLAKNLAKDSWGNWGRAKGKLARIAKMEEEQLAKYGIQAGQAANLDRANKADSSSRSEDDEDSDSGSGPFGAVEKGKKKKKKKKKTGKEVEVEADKSKRKKNTRKKNGDVAAAPPTPSPEPEPQLTGEAYEGKPSQSTVDATWWVNAKFQWGGLVGSARERSGDVSVASVKR